MPGEAEGRENDRTPGLLLGLFDGYALGDVLGGALGRIKGGKVDDKMLELLLGRVS